MRPQPPVLLFSKNYSDVILAGAGNDEVLPGPGNDIVNGGSGDEG